MNNLLTINITVPALNIYRKPNPPELTEAVFFEPDCPVDADYVKYHTCAGWNFYNKERVYTDINHRINGYKPSKYDISNRIYAPRSACGRTPAQFRRDAKDDLSNVECYCATVFSSKTDWRECDFLSLSSVFKAVLDKGRHWNFKNFRITPQLPEWVKYGEKCYYNNILYTINGVLPNAGIADLSNEHTTCPSVKIDKLTKAVPVPLNGSNIIAFCGGWEIKVGDRRKRIRYVCVRGILTTRNQEHNYKYLAEHGTTLDGKPLYTWKPESEVE